MQYSPYHLQDITVQEYLSKQRSDQVKLFRHQTKGRCAYFDFYKSILDNIVLIWRVSETISNRGFLQVLFYGI